MWWRHSFILRGSGKKKKPGTPHWDSFLSKKRSNIMILKNPFSCLEEFLWGISQKTYKDLRTFQAKWGSVSWQIMWGIVDTTTLGGEIFIWLCPTDINWKNKGLIVSQNWTLCSQINSQPWLPHSYLKSPMFNCSYSTPPLWFYSQSTST